MTDLVVLTLVEAMFNGKGSGPSQTHSPKKWMGLADQAS